MENGTKKRHDQPLQKEESSRYPHKSGTYKCGQIEKLKDASFFKTCFISFWL